RSRLGRERRRAWRLVPFGEGLDLFTPVGPQDFASTGVAMRTWRSEDGATWRPVGTFRWSMPARYEGIWRAGIRDIAATPERLVLFVAIGSCCGAGGDVPASGRFASLTATSTTRVPHQGLAIWSSPTGERWARGSNEAFRGPDGLAWIADLRQVPGALLATSEAPNDSLLETTDGREWIKRASLPPSYTWSGSTGLIAVEGTYMVASDDHGSPGARSMGNRLGVWLLEQDGSWTKTIDMQPGFTHSQVAVGRTVIVVGSSWGRGPERWPWTKVSLDGGRTWDEGSSWSGAQGACAGEIVALGQRVVMRDCSDDAEVTLWVTDLPAGESPSPEASPGT
ncbi:MAG: hypothetical protein ABWZ82_09795, partial [Candidatus Limnocylindrales bacterium]